MALKKSDSALGVALSLRASPKPKEPEGEEGEPMTDEGALQAGAREFLDAVARKDAKALASAFRSMAGMCMDMEKTGEYDSTEE